MVVGGATKLSMHAHRVNRGRVASSMERQEWSDVAVHVATVAITAIGRTVAVSFAGTTTGSTPVAGITATTAADTDTSASAVWTTVVTNTAATRATGAVVAFVVMTATTIGVHHSRYAPEPPRGLRLPSRTTGNREGLFFGWKKSSAGKRRCGKAGDVRRVEGELSGRTTAVGGSEQERDAHNCTCHSAP